MSPFLSTDEDDWGHYRVFRGYPSLACYRFFPEDSMTRRIAALAAFVALAAGPAAARSLDMYWVDVEGGAATLIVTPSGESLLVDTGNPGGRDPGRIHHVAAEVAGLKRIDHVVITHLHRDHFGGLAELASLIPIGTVWASPLEAAPAEERGQKDVAAYQAAKVEKRVVAQAGAEIPLTQAKGAAPLHVRFISARQDLVAPSAFRANDAACKELVERPVDFSDNANSVGIVLELGGFRFFDGGDLTWNVEGRLVCPFDRIGTIDVYQSDHHGLDLSNNPVLVRSLSPTVVVFNNGPKKGCGPGSYAAARAPESLQAIYQVHKNLNEGASNTDDARIANQALECAGEHVQLSVEPGGDRYTVRVPSTKHEAAYVTRTH
jgi:competence protein ComEC